MEATTNLNQTYEEFVASRKNQIGGSDIPSVVGVGRYACPRKPFYDKTGVPKDVDDSGKMEFRRGRRLEGIAAEYYEQATGREIRVTTTARIPGKPHLAVNIDRLVKAEGKKGWGAAEIKVVGRFSWLHIKKEGLIDDYVLQLQYNMGVKGVDWGCFIIYCPDLDELMYWDVEADKALGETLLEKADDYYVFHIECGVIPDALPLGSPPCDGCAWFDTCREGIARQVVPDGEILRPDLADWAAKFAEVKGMGKEAEGAAEALKAEFIEAVKEKPGNYRCGKFLIPFTIKSQMRFSGELLKKKDPALYESLKKETIIKTVPMPKEE